MKKWMRSFLLTAGIIFMLVSVVQADPVNLALTGTATQSSEPYSLYPPLDGLASKAIDDNTDGNWYSGSVTHTDSDYEAWWQVDLGNSFVIDEIVLWNRTDYGPGRLTNFTVSVFNGSTTPVWFQLFTGYPNPSLSITTFNNEETTKGRIVKVQLYQHSDYLSLAEVQVFQGTTTPPVTTPEPTTMLLLGLGLIGIAGVRRKMN